MGRKAVVAAVVFAVLVLVMAVAAYGQEGNPNDPGYWEDQFDHAATCVKIDPPDGDNPYGSLTSDGLAVVLNPYQQAWPGDHYEALIVKSGTVDIGYGPGNAVYVHPSAGVEYTPPPNPGGQAPQVSHWIVCFGTTPDPTTTTTTTTSTTTSTTTTTTTTLPTTTTTLPTTTTTTVDPGDTTTTVETLVFPVGGVATGGGSTAGGSNGGMALVGLGMLVLMAAAALWAHGFGMRTGKE